MNMHSGPFSLRHPELGTGPVPTMPYVSPAYFELERKHIFKKSWLMVGRISEIPKVGDYVLKQIEVADAEILLARDANGQIGAFYNACSHRAARVVSSKSGNARGFSCPYHSWTYGLDGKLRSVPSEKKFYDLVKENCGLAAIAVDVWQGFVFVNLDPNPAQGLREYLGGLADYAEGFPFDQDAVAMRVEFSVLNCNWKVALDAFQESYHLGFLHRQTLTGIFSSQERPHGDPIAIETYGLHRTVSMWVNTAHKPGPVEALAQRFASNINSVSDSTSLSAKERLRQQAPGINPARDPGWGVDANVIFPNTQFLAMAGSYQVFQFWPISVDSCRMTMTAYYDRPKTAGERFARECGFAHTKGVVLEDIFNCEGSQKAHKSRAKKYLTLQDGEGAIRYNLHLIDQILAPYVTAEMREY